MWELSHKTAKTVQKSQKTMHYHKPTYLAYMRSAPPTHVEVLKELNLSRNSIVLNTLSATRGQKIDNQVFKKKIS